MSAVPLAVPFVWTRLGREHLQTDRKRREIGSDCLAHQEIFR
jgi:hypothetical protein